MAKDVKLMRRFIGDHWLTLIVVVLAVGTTAVFVFSEYGYFCDQASDHHTSPCPGFWSAQHLHDLLYNAAANWQSELWFGVLLVILLHKAHGGDEA
jgi:hypothetical protein